MAERRVKIWYDPEGDYLEVVFDQKPGYFRETSSDQVMEKVDDTGNILGFSVMKASESPLLSRDPLPAADAVDTGPAASAARRLRRGRDGWLTLSHAGPDRN